MLLRHTKVALATLLSAALSAAAERPFAEDYTGEAAGDGGLPTRGFDWQMTLAIFGPILVTGMLAERWPWFRWLNLVAWLWPIVLGGWAALSKGS